MRFLKGLNEQFSGVRSQILLMNPLPHINDVCGLVMQQECQFMSENREVTKTLATTTTTTANNRGNGAFGKRPSKGKSAKGGQSPKLCSFYGKAGYTVDTCFKKHGFPHHFKKGVNAVQTDALASDECDDEAEQVGEAQPSPNISLTQEQYQCLLALFQQKTVMYR